MSLVIKIFWSFFFILIVIGFPFSCKTGDNEYTKGEVLIKFKPNTSLATIDSVRKEIGLSKVKEIPKLGVMLYKIQSNMTVKEIIEKYKDHPSIEYIEPNYQYKID